MFEKILEFVERHYILTLIFFVVIFGAGITYAANPKIFSYVFSSNETVISVDNSVLLNTDLDNFNPNIKINAIVESKKDYRVDYSHGTLVVKDSVWQYAEIDDSLYVDKSELGNEKVSKYAANKITENVSRQILYLKTVQAEEKEKGETEKVVETSYGGIIGGLITPSTTVSSENATLVPNNTSATGNTENNLNPDTIAMQIENIINQPPITTSTLPTDTQNPSLTPNPSSTNPTPTPIPTYIPPFIISSSTPNPALNPTPKSYVTPSPSPTPPAIESPDVVNVGPAPE